MLFLLFSIDFSIFSTLLLLLLCIIIFTSFDIPTRYGSFKTKQKKKINSKEEKGKKTRKDIRKISWKRKTGWSTCLMLICIFTDKLVTFSFYELCCHVFLPPRAPLLFISFYHLFVCAVCTKSSFLRSFLFNFRISFILLHVMDC